jgi:hypothetical protein
MLRTYYMNAGSKSAMRLFGFGGIALGRSYRVRFSACAKTFQAPGGKMGSFRSFAAQRTKVRLGPLTTLIRPVIQMMLRRIRGRL